MKARTSIVAFLLTETVVLSLVVGLAAHMRSLLELIWGHQQELAPVTIIAHSLGGSVALRYAGIYPENVERMVVIEGTLVAVGQVTTGRSTPNRIRHGLAIYRRAALAPRA